MSGNLSWQLPLAIRLSDEATFKNFFVNAANRPVVSFLETFAQLAHGQQYGFIHGSAYSGRSHLLQAVCHRVQSGRSALYLAMQEVAQYPAKQVLESLEGCDLVCLDDLQVVLGDSQWEEQLFHLFNRLHAAGTSLLLTADAAPSQLATRLPDLQSRLAWGVVYQLPVLTDEDKIKLLCLRAGHRGLELSADVAQYTVYRSSRSLDDLLALLDKLDHAALAAQRRLTIPFVKSVCGW